MRMRTRLPRLLGGSAPSNLSRCRLQTEAVWISFVCPKAMASEASEVAKVLSSAPATMQTSPVVVPNPLRRPGPAVGPTFLAAMAVQPPVPTPLVAAAAHIPAATSTTLPLSTACSAVQLRHGSLWLSAQKSSYSIVSKLQVLRMQLGYDPCLNSLPPPQRFIGILMGTMPPSTALPYLPANSAGVAAYMQPVQAVAAAQSPEQAMSLAMPVGMVFGEGFITLPSRLVSKIQNLEFVEMSESWVAESTGSTAPDTQKCCVLGAKPRRPPVTDVLIWAQCFAALVG